MKKQILLLVSLLMISSTSAGASTQRIRFELPPAPKNYVSECVHFTSGNEKDNPLKDKGIRWAFCITKHKDLNRHDPTKIVYLQHGAALNEVTGWTTMGWNIRKIWDSMEIKTPTVVSVSFKSRSIAVSGESLTDWLLNSATDFATNLLSGFQKYKSYPTSFLTVDDNDSPLSGLYPIFINQVMPYIETEVLEISNPIRYLMGASMGGFNTAQMVFKDNGIKLFDKAVIACPGISGVNPFAPTHLFYDYGDFIKANSKIWRKDLTRFLRQVYLAPATNIESIDLETTQAITEASTKYQEQENPFYLASKANTNHLPEDIYFAVTSEDQFGFYRSTLALYDYTQYKFRNTEINTYFQTAKGKHCNFFNDFKLKNPDNQKIIYTMAKLLSGQNISGATPLLLDNKNSYFDPSLKDPRTGQVLLKHICQRAKEGTDPDMTGIFDFTESDPSQAPVSWDLRDINNIKIPDSLIESKGGTARLMMYTCQNRGSAYHLYYDDGDTNLQGVFYPRNAGDQNVIDFEWVKTPANLLKSDEGITTGVLSMQDRTE